MSRKRNKQLSEDELREVEEFVWSKNVEENKFLQTMTIKTKCKNENKKCLDLSALLASAWLMMVCAYTFLPLCSACMIA